MNDEQSVRVRDRMKRKRSRQAEAVEPEAKRTKTVDRDHLNHPVLSAFYPRLQTLRQYLLCHLPRSSKRRRQKVERLGKRDTTDLSDLQRSLHRALGDLLDHALVARLEVDDAEDENTRTDRQRDQDIQHFSQQLGGSSTLSSSADGRSVYQSELVDFVVWRLFNRVYPSEHRPPHVLCHGVQRISTTHNVGLGAFASSSMPGLTCMFPNEHLEQVKNPLWSKVLNSLGVGGDRIMMDLLTHCGVFVPLEHESARYYQLSGRPVSEMKPSRDRTSHTKAASFENEKGSATVGTKRKASEVRFVRHRMLYARAALNAKSEVILGLRHIHVFNRFPNASDERHTTRIMQYAFPRQFGLHNVFTSIVDPKETSQPFKDYTLREQEIAEQELAAGARSGHADSSRQRCVAVPKRLRGRCFLLVARLQKRHSRCSYTEMLRHYCPLPVALPPPSSKRSQHDTSTQGLPHFASLASSNVQVSAFCRACVQKVFPHQLLGEDSATGHNWKILLANVDAFVKARRLESYTLEYMMHGLRLQHIQWLCPPNLTLSQRIARPDYDKRREILMELVYYIFDSFLIPLIRSNFHVTESSVHRNRLFYFRHDVWRRISEPALTRLRTSMLEELPNIATQKLLSRRALGYSSIRLLPKENGMRPIANLRKRMQVMRNGNKALGRSINSIITPAFNVLNFEKSNQPNKLGSSLFSVSGIYERLRSFRARLNEQGLKDCRFYFAKVDVKSCFDNLPQEKVIKLTQKLLSCNEYHTNRLAEMKVGETCHGVKAGSYKPIRKFHADTKVQGVFESFSDTLASCTRSKSRGSIFVDAVVKQTTSRRQALQLLSEHVQRNVIKIGKKFYRQKNGIPQGSILSSLLCNLLYAEYEQERLGFLDQEPHVMLRLIDDFLLITPSQHLAKQFLQVTGRGDADYGVYVKPEKSLANFAVEVGHTTIPQLTHHSAFPYCGMTIDTKSLNVCKDPASFRRTRTEDTLTVEYSKLPGESFRRKMLRDFSSPVRD
ncbi:MAG: hypothetical protein M1828_000069 [Chrysothrix sp. TS-e1954]|nr:MAG: hypothetical protein M1828_000069 [Chrysothrix sp. TS-e1954]